MTRHTWGAVLCWSSDSGGRRGGVAPAAVVQLVWRGHWRLLSVGEPKLILWLARACGTEEAAEDIQHGWRASPWLPRKNIYKILDQVLENDFHVIKSVVKLRPVRHRTE